MKASLPIPLSGLGAALWREITQVVFLDLNMRSALQGFYAAISSRCAMVL